MDTIGVKLNESYPGKVVRKDLTKQIKEGAKVPTDIILKFSMIVYSDPVDAAFKVMGLN